MFLRGFERISGTKNALIFVPRSCNNRRIRPLKSAGHPSASSTSQILTALAEESGDFDIVFVVHPRAKVVLLRGGFLLLLRRRFLGRILLRRWRGSRRRLRRTVLLHRALLRLWSRALLRRAEVRLLFHLALDAAAVFKTRCNYG